MDQFAPPIFVLAKDCGEVRHYDSVQTLESALEPIDVENDEYEAWDSAAVPLTLTVQKGVKWLQVVASGVRAPERLREAINRFARSENVDVDLSSLQRDDFAAALATVTNAVEARRQSLRWWRRLRHRS